MYACIHVSGLRESELTSLRECAGSFSPHVETIPPDIILLDIRGLKNIYGAPRQIAEALSSSSAALGHEASIAIASTPLAAVSAARGCRGITVIPPGQEAAILQNVPLNILNPGEELQETLSCWGIRTFADLAALPEIGIAERLGSEGLRLQRLACGFDVRPLVADSDTAVFEDSIELEHPLDLLEPLSFLLSRLLIGICSRLTSAGLASNQIDLRLSLENRAEFTRTLRLPFAGRDPGAFLKLLQLDLAAHPPTAAITAIFLAAQPVQPRVVQTGLFVPLAPHPEKLELTLARIASLVGPENVGTPEILNTHRPGAFAMRKFEASDNGTQPAAPSFACLAIRRFRPPLRASVLSPFGFPQRIAAKGINGNIATYAGPWRTSGDWWTMNMWARDEWDIGMHNGALYRIYREGHHGWFVEGNYD
jgi:protein ImuB